MNTRFFRDAALCLLQAAAVFSPALTSHAAPVDSSLVLLATRALDESAFRQTVVLAVPDGNGSHFGFVLNRPTEISLAELFPGDPASQHMKARVHIGGPFLTNSVFALVRGKREPEAGTFPVTPDLFAALKGAAVDRVIADRPDDARFFVGLVAWQPGELANELRAGAWEPLDPEPDLVLSADSSDMWNRLTTLAHAIRASWTYSRTWPVVNWD